MNIFELFGKIGIDNKSANKAIDETVGNAERSSGKIVSTFKKMAGILGGLFVGKKIFDFGESAVEAAATAKAIQSQFDQVFGDLKGKAQEQLNGIADEVGALPNRIKPAFNQIASFAKVSGMDAQQSLDYASRATMAAADSAAFYDKSLEETTETLKSYLKGNYEVADNLGILSTEQTRNAKATEMFGQEFQKLDGIQKQEVLMAMFEDANKVSGAMGQAARESDGFENVMGNLNQAWQDFLVIVGGPLLSPVVTGLQNTTTWLQETGKWTQDLMAKLEQNGAIQSFKTAFDNVSSVLGDVTGSIGDFVNNLLGIDGKSASVDGVADSFKKVSDFLSDATGKIKDFVGWFEKGGPAVDGLKSAVVGVTTAWAGYKVVTGTIQAIETARNALLAVGNGLMLARSVQSGILTVAEATQTAATMGASGAFGIFNAVLSANPIAIVIMAITALVAALVWFFTQTEIGRQMWSSFTSFLLGTWNSIVSSGQAIWTSLSTFFTFILNAIFNTFSSIWSSITSLISNAVSGIYNSVTSTFQNVWTTVTSIWNGIKDTISNAIIGAKDIVASTLETMKGLFNFEWSLPRPKIPGFSVSGGEAPWGFMGEGSLPSIGVEWYAKGGIMNGPTVFGMNGNNLMVGGEAGPEAVLPLNEPTMSMLAGLIMEQISDKIVVEAPKQETQPQQVNLQVDGKTFAKLLIGYISEEQAQRMTIVEQGGALGW